MCFLQDLFSEKLTDTKLLTEYADMVKRLADMDEAFKGWESNKLNDEKIKYYIDVSSKVAQKLLDAAA